MPQSGDVRNRRCGQIATLFRGLGGGWNSADPPTGDGVQQFEPLDIAASGRQARPDGMGLRAEEITGPR
jgi:hypothetical protein